MMGPPNDPGVNIRSLKELFRVTSERAKEVDFKLKVWPLKTNLFYYDCLR